VRNKIVRSNLWSTLRAGIGVSFVRYKPKKENGCQRKTWPSGKGSLLPARTSQGAEKNGRVPALNTGAKSRTDYNAGNSAGEHYDLKVTMSSRLSAGARGRFLSAFCARGDDRGVCGDCESDCWKGQGSGGDPKPVFMGGMGGGR